MANQSKEFVCQGKRNQFCFICARFAYSKGKKPFKETLQNRYKAVFNVTTIDALDESYAPAMVCGSCIQALSYVVNNQGNKDKLRIKKPAVWNKPAANHSNCYMCKTKLSSKQMRRPSTYDYDHNLSCELPKVVKISKSVENGNKKSNKHNGEVLQDIC